MTEFGFYASLEQFTPSACLDQVELAERHGFESIWVNDHFHPWFDTFPDGSSANGGNCWAWLPAALERTDSIDIGTGVTAVLNRLHPANVAHRLATLLDIAPDRVFLGLGTGEAINEVPLGLPWPSYTERARRTAEAIRLVRKLFEAEYVEFDGDFWTLDGANLYTGPDSAPPIHVAGSGSTAARMAGDLGDGLFTVPSGPPSQIESELFPAVRSGVERSERNDSFEDVDTTINLLCSYADTETAAMASIEPWKLFLAPDVTDSNIGDPREIQRRAATVDRDELASAYPITTDAGDIIEAIEPYVDAGFDRVVLQSVSPDQEQFCTVFEREIRPSFA